MEELCHSLLCMKNTHPLEGSDDPKIKYCLYARKSSESDEQQALSIDSQAKEMFQLAQREGLDVIDIKRESHSAKSAGQHQVFSGRFCGASYERHPS